MFDNCAYSHKLLIYRTQFGFDARKVSERLGKRMRASLAIDADKVSPISDVSWLLISEVTTSVPYLVRHCAEMCNGRTGIGECYEAFQRCGGCRHTFACTCPDATAGGQTCKHILDVLRVTGIWNPILSSQPTHGMITHPSNNVQVTPGTCETECQELMSYAEVILCCA